MSIAASWSTQHDGPWVRPQDRDDWRMGAILAAGAHLALVGALALGVSWKSDPPQVAEAELWAAVPTVAAPPVPPPTPPSPAPEPVVREVSPPPEPEPVRAAPQADLGITPPREVFDTTPPKRPAPQPEPKPEPKPKPPPKPEPKPEPKKATPPPPKPAAPQPEARMTAAEREAQRQANLMRMMSELGSLGTSGQDAQSGGPSSNYAGRIKARIKPNIVFTEWAQGNPVAVVEVRCAPDGRILSSRLLTSSGVPAWDAAVLRAVERTEVLPANEQGKVPSAIVIEFRPRD
jgi:colicin import membrane protein